MRHQDTLKIGKSRTGKGSRWSRRAALKLGIGAAIAAPWVRNAKAAVGAARDALGLTFEYVEAFEAEAERLIQTTLTDGQFDDLIEATFGPLDPEASERTKQADADLRSRLVSVGQTVPVPAASGDASAAAGAGSGFLPGLQNGARARATSRGVW